MGVHHGVVEVQSDGILLLPNNNTLWRKALKFGITHSNCSREYNLSLQLSYYMCKSPYSFAGLTTVSTMVLRKAVLRLGMVLVKHVEDLVFVLFLERGCYRPQASLKLAV